MIRPEFIFPEYEITICSCYVNSVKSTELHVTRGLKQAGTAEATSNGIVETEGVQQMRPPASKASASSMSCSMDVNALWIRLFFFFF